MIKMARRGYAFYHLKSSGTSRVFSNGRRSGLGVYLEIKGLLTRTSAGVRELISNETFPFVIVAHDGERYIGSTLGIASDMDERPEYTPWVAAVWVEAQFRGQNVGRSLVSCAAGNLLHVFQRVYLCARATRHGFYVRQGWVPIERDVGEKQLTVLTRRMG
jgi:GNAT superfamily N-acetyltransferase